MRPYLIIFTLLVLLNGSLSADERGSSAPYISGDTFRGICKHSYDELRCALDPLDVCNGDTVFVKGDYLDEFLCVEHPKITQRYVVVIHNSDEHVTEKYKPYLDEEKTIAWFAQNAIYHHPKLIPIPIGIANRCWPHGNIDTVEAAQQVLPMLEKDILAYLNISISTYVNERSYVAALFQNEEYCYASGVKSYFDYLCDLGRSKFVFSPRGNGIDCHRTWESLLMGAIPIVRRSPIDSIYEGLPVLIVDEWTDVTEDFLEAKYTEMQEISFDLSRVYSDYWLDLILQATVTN